MSMQEVREQNIALVTQTALACFVENGIEKTTIRDIAQHAGLTERSVYRYFATKDELVVAAAFLYWDRAKAQAAQALSAARQPGMTGVEEIRVLLRSYAGLIFTDPAGIRFSLDAEVALCNAGRQHAVVNRPPERYEVAPGPIAAGRACTSSTGTRASTRCASSSRAHSRRLTREKKGQGIPFKYYPTLKEEKAWQNDRIFSSWPRRSVLRA